MKTYYGNCDYENVRMVDICTEEDFIREQKEDPDYAINLKPLDEAIEYAKKYDIPFFIGDVPGYDDPHKYDELKEILRKNNVKFV